MPGLAGPVPLWGGNARARTAQPVFCKSHTCPVGTAGAEGPPSGGPDGPQGLATGGSRPGASPSDHPYQPWAQSRPATGLTELRLSTCQKSEESVVNWVCNKPLKKAKKLKSLKCKEKRMAIANWQRY